MITRRSNFAPEFSLIVAATDDDTIGIDNQLPWRLSRDLQQFKRLTMGHHIVMGRKTFESIGRVLPGRTCVVITRQQSWSFPGVVVVHDLAQLQEIIASDLEPFVVGGAEIYAWLLPKAKRIYLTRVHTNLAGDAHLPLIDWSLWRLKHSEAWDSDDKNQFPATFQIWERLPP